MNAVDDVCVWAVCDLVKLYVEDITNAGTNFSIQISIILLKAPNFFLMRLYKLILALDYEENCGESGPISPEAIIAASFKLKLEQREHEESTTR